ncbi:hypothetical protein COCCADRAFT_88829 [Bipolaris zeicola 26-R-13]|uniref:Uncharacterized protein n=1 Tax=Cochliobolus carbonum (strain 26-R-13) TaxID=930089 RepID=W6YKR9_COCC2|nr:uncharacterized protein COCCADRAFT_88829 [Bipolaris zeicola 26-R-13]EUC36229.1 hypothetical protein COCCADRAFT_88829 [Bipolaris zeicola 26-R-13]
MSVCPAVRAVALSTSTPAHHTKKHNQAPAVSPQHGRDHVSFLSSRASWCLKTSHRP